MRWLYVRGLGRRETSCRHLLISTLFKTVIGDKVVEINLDQVISKLLIEAIILLQLQIKPGQNSRSGCM